MSQFEYVSVALALLYSFAIARLLTALPSVTSRDRGYAIHAAWVCVVLLATVATWWTVWSLRDVSWTAWRFLWILSVPALIHLRAGILVSDAPAEVASWKEHYYRRRVPFFAVGAVMGVNALLIPWAMGAVTWFSPAPAHMAAFTLMGISVVGLATRRPGVHGALVIVNIVMLLSFLAIAGSGFDA